MTGPEPRQEQGTSEMVEHPPLADLVRLLWTAATLLAPSAMFTALCYFFGWQYAYSFYDYFGVSWSALGLTTSDYLLRSLDALMTPIMVSIVLGLLTLWLYGPVRDRLTAWLAPRAKARPLMPVLAVAAGLLVLNGLSVDVARTPLNQGLGVAPLSLAGGILLFAWTVRLHQGQRGDLGRLGVAAGVFLTVSGCLFWAANDYAAGVGRGRAIQLVAALPMLPSTVLYSAHSLSLKLPAEGVRETRCVDPDATYRFRYDGLTLIQQSGNQYLLLPKNWSPNTGVAILLPRNDSLRLEFSPSSAHGVSSAVNC